MKAVSRVTARKIGDELRVHWPSVDLEQFRRGLEIEQEHTRDLRIAAQIALDHLREDRHYYTKLQRAGLETGARAMGYVREVREQAQEQAQEQEQGRQFEYEEWLDFECDPAKPTPELREMAQEFRKLALEFLESYARTWSIDLGELDEDAFVWNAYASLVGHGVGLWEGDGATGLSGEDEKKIDRALKTQWYAKGTPRARLHELAHRISDECAMLSEESGGREAGEARRRARRPSRRRPLSRRAPRTRRASGPRRDPRWPYGFETVHWQGEAIEVGPIGEGWFSARLRGGSFVGRSREEAFDKAKRFFGGARDRDDAPTTERMPAPEAAPRLQPGYAFYSPSRGKGWRRISDDDWEQVIVTENEIERANLLGYRLIDGSMHDVFEVVFAHGPGGRGFYAQLQTQTRGRGAAHEESLAQANDFASPGEAVAHAQRTWDATHVDFHGTRTQPTVYGTRDGARWKKTLYKERGKFHWPDKFYRGPKRLPSGAIELTPAATIMPPSGAGEARTRWSDRMILESVRDGHMMTPEARNRAFDLIAVGLIDAHGTWKLTPKGKDALRHGYDDGLIVVEPDPRPMWARETRDNPATERFLLSYLPYSDSEIARLSKRSRGTIEEWFHTHEQAEQRMHQLIREKQIERAEIREDVRGYAMGKLVVEWDETQPPPSVCAARDNPATDLQDAIPWVRVTRDPERYKEAIERARKIGPIDDAKKVYELVGPALLKEDQETFIVVLIDVRQNCRGVAEVHRGERSRVGASMLDILRVVVASGAEGFIVCHNHPSGKAMPSPADRSLTKAIERAAKPFKGETAFLDHVVIGANEYFSFANDKLYRAS